MNDMDRLVALLRSARRGVAFTGAGISTESGLSDFRSPGGIWSRHRPAYYDEFVSSRAARARYWQMRLEFYPELMRARPNAGHRALAALEQRGTIVAVVTQNIDGLHQQAGTRRVIELHGTARQVACIACGRDVCPDEVLERVRAGDVAPDCQDCGAPLKSKTVSFGQPMPAAAMEEATGLARRADVFLAIGSSLVVEPAASLPRLAVRAGAKLAIINKTDTPLDPLADVIVRAPIGGSLKAVLDQLGCARLCR